MAPKKTLTKTPVKAKPQAQTPAAAPQKQKQLTPAQRKSVSTFDGQGVVINGKRTNFISFPDED